MTEHDGSGEIVPPQCRAVSVRGVRCRERARDGERYCVQHATPVQRRVTGMNGRTYEDELRRIEALIRHLTR